MWNIVLPYYKIKSIVEVTWSVTSLHCFAVELLCDPPYFAAGGILFQLQICLCFCFCALHELVGLTYFVVWIPPVAYPNLQIHLEAHWDPQNLGHTIIQISNPVLVCFLLPLPSDWLMNSPFTLGGQQEGIGTGRPEIRWPTGRHRKRQTRAWPWKLWTLFP